MGHPRPLLRRDPWWSLDGTWDFALDVDAGWEHPDDVGWDRTITVPFAPETKASGVDHRSYLESCWYRRRISAPDGARAGDRLVLHFGAVDHSAAVWVDGQLLVVTRAATRRSRST